MILNGNKVLVPTWVVKPTRVWVREASCACAVMTPSQTYEWEIILALILKHFNCTHSVA